MPAINISKIQKMIKEAEGVFVRQADDSVALYVHEGEVMRIILEYAHGLTNTEFQSQQSEEE
jgi:hypothetical protein